MKPMTALGRLFIIFIIGPSWAYECVPWDHRISNEPITFDSNGVMLTPAAGAAISARGYCTGKEYGGGEICYDWTFTANNDCKSDTGTGKSCPCSFSSAGCTGIYCKCHMQGDDDTTWCYKDTGACASCDKGEFALGCGCIQCNKALYGQSRYDRSIYNFEYNSCDYDKWICGRGSCRACPAGSKCAGGNTMPVPCPAGVSYQPDPKATECLPCTCQNNEYIPTSVKDSIKTCGGKVGMAGLCKPCDICSDHVDIPATPSATQQCPPRNWNYGRDITSGQCVPCKQCEQPATHFSLVGDTQNFCYTGQPTLECKQQYYAVLSDTAASSQVHTAAGNVVQGPIPFKLGWQRNRGTQHRAGDPLPANSDPAVNRAVQGYKAVLPYYTRCPRDSMMPNATASSSGGNVRKASTSRIRTLSTFPPK
jgi:hypothetical protein